jgi:hypothetical protein
LRFEDCRSDRLEDFGALRALAQVSLHVGIRPPGVRAGELGVEVSVCFGNALGAWDLGKARRQDYLG